jgi:hypothetical protein
MKLLSSVIVLALVITAPAFAEDAAPPSAAATAHIAAAMTDAASRYLIALDDADRPRSAIAFDDPRRLDWHNIPKPERKGIQLRDMSEVQRNRCYDLLRTALSDSGYKRVMNILALENNLRDGEKNLVGGQLRDPQRYFLTIFGKPAAMGSWGWSFEGHHCSLNFTIRDGEVIADTPSFWGACPATVKTFVEGGPEVGARTLGQEEELAFELLNSLSDAQRKVAIIADKAPADYRNPGLPEPPHEAPAGLVAANMDSHQRELLDALLAEYTGHLAPELAAARMGEIHNGGWDAVRFAWLGATEPGVGHAYRVEGPTFILELVNFQSDPQGNPANHIHSVWRDPRGDFGMAAKP